MALEPRTVTLDDEPNAELVDMTRRGATAGVLIKNAEALERLASVDTLVIDKTGNAHRRQAARRRDRGGGGRALSDHRNADRSGVGQRGDDTALRISDRERAAAAPAQPVTPIYNRSCHSPR
jgi:hypothetical protein